MIDRPAVKVNGEDGALANVNLEFDMLSRGIIGLRTNARPLAGEAIMAQSWRYQREKMNIPIDARSS